MLIGLCCAGAIIFRCRGRDTMRKQVLYGLDLHVGELRGDDFVPSMALSIDDVRKALRAGLEHITRISVRKGWHCVVGYVLSEHDTEGHARHPHAHLVIYGTPCSEIGKELKNHWVHYWASRHYKILPTKCFFQKNTTDGRISYMWAQRSGNFCIRAINYQAEYAAELFQCSVEDAPYYLRRDGLTRNVLFAWLGYRDNSDVPDSVTLYPMIEDRTRDYDSAYLLALYGHKVD